ncbi:cupin domain-containing protein [Hymenobacter negativus]|uniref:Cupin domain-containing protein n=1 Tax=Hymenobacter negativus TaxID=2795026 RepID=A0ABS3QLC6_9BACT|nr:cupin domain-containing protein [Hymenobacter negativus]MBO2012032.1 cupin domain-containing protein [Hymenobacter negativus]
MPSPFFSAAELLLVPMGPGVQRQVLAQGPDLMLVRVTFEQDAVGALHEHPHQQISYVESGKFEYTIAGEKRLLGSGDSCLVSGNTLHGVRCLVAGVLIDTFTPRRDDFL